MFEPKLHRWTLTFGVMACVASVGSYASPKTLSSMRRVSMPMYPAAKANSVGRLSMEKFQQPSRSKKLNLCGKSLHQCSLAVVKDKNKRRCRTFSTGVTAPDVNKKVSKRSKRIVTGWLLAFAGTAIIFSGNLVYTAILTTVAMIAQYEYFSTVMLTSVNPARRISFVASLAMFMCACLFPLQHQLGLPLGFAAIVMWFLVMRPKPGSIADISTTLMGLVYTGLLPSYWARMRCLQDVPGVSESLSFNLDCGLRWLSPIPLAADVVTQGAITYWFTALGCALSDVAAYFGGKKFGKTKISEVCPAAGGASPNKTVEGFLSGAVAAMLTALIGAKVMGWPHWAFTGATYGILIAFISLVGDLMASMIKRDAGVKDFGTIFPGHGGVLDRLDSYIFVGPAAFAFVTLFLPFVEKMGAGTGLVGVLSAISSVGIMCTVSRRDFWTQSPSMFNNNNEADKKNTSSDDEWVAPTLLDEEDSSRL